MRHLTIYRYRQPVAFGEHRMMLRPREGHDQRILEERLDIDPMPVDMRWLHDVFGNSVGIARFEGRARELRVASTIRLDHTPTNALEYPMERDAETYPFSYDLDDLADLARSIERQYPDPDREVDRWARQFVRRDGPTGTRELLTGMTNAIRQRFAYIVRPERGVQMPAQTLAMNSGTCRDFAVLMIEAVRSLGIAARFVSGYLHVPRGGSRLGGGATHAWLRVYLPGAGWVELDPTNGIIGNRDLIRVAVARDHRHVLPLHGTWIGFPSDSLGMTVEVDVTAAE
ncbi:transglutaminase family protein [Elioraea sp.]|uniref:transglutaminase family protein n=1 Tax=Elioraea sp. TaxID=2185103 RepID=UPI0025B83199|nr:transglutaminase family protein [Elioraea sp.]